MCLSSAVLLVNKYDGSKRSYGRYGSFQGLNYYATSVFRLFLTPDKQATTYQQS